MVLFALVTIVAVFPWFAIAIVFLGVAFGFLFVYFRAAIRELKRLDNTSRYI